MTLSEKQWKKNKKNIFHGFFFSYFFKFIQFLPKNQTFLNIYSRTVFQNVTIEIKTSFCLVLPRKNLNYFVSWIYQIKIPRIIKLGSNLNMVLANIYQISALNHQLNISMASLWSKRTVFCQKLVDFQIWSSFYSILPSGFKFYLQS